MNARKARRFRRESLISRLRCINRSGVDSAVDIVRFIEASPSSGTIQTRRRQGNHPLFQAIWNWTLRCLFQFHCLSPSFRNRRTKKRKHLRLARQFGRGGGLPTPQAMHLLIGSINPRLQKSVSTIDGSLIRRFGKVYYGHAVGT